MISREFIEQLKSKTDIVDLIGGYCRLEKRGSSYWARCPLPGHVEKTASFSVNEIGQFYKCFGCQRGGDAIKFVMEIESLSYPEAIKLLADRAGLEIPNESFDEEKSDEKRKKRQIHVDILKKTARFYVNNLKEPSAAPYLEYLAERSFTTETLKTFGIGVSLDYKKLPKYLSSIGFSLEDAYQAGVLSKNDNGEYSDFEAKRFVVPIIDATDNVVGFGGRVIVKTDFQKYKNTRETLIFNKSRCLYNLNNLKKVKRQLGTLPYILLVEGYMDVIAVHSAGIKTAVASMGTSLTEEQAKMISRYTDTVIVCYDGDSAGQKATFRAVPILEDAGLNVKIVSLPEGMDPDDAVKNKGAAYFVKLVEQSEPVNDYKISYLQKRFDDGSVLGRRKFLTEALKVVQGCKMNFEQERLLKRLSIATKITYESLRRDVGVAASKNDESPAISPKTATNEGKAIEKAERFLIFSFLTKADYFKEKDFESYQFISEQREKFFNIILSENVKPESLVDFVEENDLEELNAILTSADKIDEANRKDYYEGCLNCITNFKLDAETKFLENEFANTNDTELRLQLAAEIQKRQKRIKK